MVKTIEFLLKDGMNIIAQRDFNNPSLDVQLILAHLLGTDRMYLHMNRLREVDEDTVNKYYEMVHKRNTGYPLQYMLGTQEFMGLDFHVEDGVLIPRPDTEILVEKIINIVNSSDMKDKDIRILDIGTGSGAIALSLAHYLKNSQVTAVDISDTALRVSNMNKESLGLINVNIVKGDVFGDLGIGDTKFDIIVSNPPYIEKDEISKLQEEVALYEPKTALDGGESGLIYYERIAEIAESISNDKFILSVEIGHNQGEAVVKLFEDLHIFDNVELNKDYGGNDRVVTGYKI